MTYHTDNRVRKYVQGYCFFKDLDLNMAKRF